MRQKKSDLKRYFTIVWYSTFFTKLYVINTALHIGRTYYYTTRLNTKGVFNLEGRPLIAKPLSRYLVLTYANQ